MTKNNKRSIQNFPRLLPYFPGIFHWYPQQECYRIFLKLSLLEWKNQIFMRFSFTITRRVYVALGFSKYFPFWYGLEPIQASLWTNGCNSHEYFGDWRKFPPEETLEKIMFFSLLNFQLFFFCVPDAFQMYFVFYHIQSHYTFC